MTRGVGKARLAKSDIPERIAREQPRVDALTRRFRGKTRPTEAEREAFYAEIRAALDRVTKPKPRGRATRDGRRS